jgi:hypothetical protein
MSRGLPPNSEQSYKGKVKTHNYINRQISQQPENCENRNDPDCVLHIIVFTISSILLAMYNLCTSSYTIVDRLILYLFLLLRFITTDNRVITFNDWIIRVNQ